MISFAQDIFISRGGRADWPRFARWHYRSHQIGLVRSIAVLWHGQPTDRDDVAPLFPETPRPHSPHPRSPRPDPSDAAGRPDNDPPPGPRPIGIAVFVSPPMSLAGRNRFFGRRGSWSRLDIRMMNRQLVLLQRLVVHPSYRGAGLSVPFLEAACDRTGVRWVETLTGLGQTHPVFERAGFVRVGRVSLPPAKRTRAGHSAIFGGRTVSAETFRKSAYTSPVYYLRRSDEHNRS